METLLAKAAPVALGSVLGFLFGLVALLVKERIELRKRTVGFRVMFFCSVKALSELLNLPPDRVGSATSGSVMSYADVVAIDARVQGDFTRYYDIYLAWMKGLYLPGNPRATLVSRHIEELAHIAERFKNK